MASAAFDMTSL
uniref:Uncharacterized protein n=1 Tax=Anguilla anguilla TaxID=7936 RepID=A0A0E9V0Q8_ANGAN